MGEIQRVQRAEQPMPVKNDDGPSVQEMVLDDLQVRMEIGIQRYGTLLRPDNGRDMLRDAYEEALDLAIYLRGAIAERDAVTPAIGDRQLTPDESASVRAVVGIMRTLELTEVRVPGRNAETDDVLFTYYDDAEGVYVYRRKSR